MKFAIKPGDHDICQVGYQFRFNTKCKFLKFQFHARAAPSAGLLTMFQSYICNIQNECNKYEDFEVKFDENLLKTT